jgi:integrase
MRIAAETTRPLPLRRNLTNAALTSVACPSSKRRLWIYDGKQPGLAVMVTPTDSKSFYVYRKVHGRPQHLRLGAFPGIGVDQARKLAQEVVGNIAKGLNPMAERRESRVRGMNLGELFAWFLENWAKPRKRSWQSDEHRYNAHLLPWAARRVTDITHTDVATLHQRIGRKSSHATANRVAALLSTMFNKARCHFKWKQENPCQGVEKFGEESRERFMSGEELKRFFTALNRESNPDWRDFFGIALYTGARRGNVLSMRWNEIDLTNGRWAIPGAKFKNGKPQVVHLAPPAVEILKSRRKNDSEWVFPGADGHLRKPQRAWRNLCRRANLQDLRIHDLRRTLGSWQAAGGTSLAIIGKSLGHRTAQATAVYARLDLEPVKASVNAAVAAMAAAGAAKSNAEEIQLSEKEERILDRVNDEIGRSARHPKGTKAAKHKDR